MRRDVDKDYMKQALGLALRGAGETSPNPMVGAIVVKNGRIVGKGYHRKAGSHHAEVNALRQADGMARGATLYVTLEPCCFTGKTPPCVDTIVEMGIKRVVVASKDPNPLNNGQGIEFLRSRGIDVELGVLKDESDKVNEAFFKFITKRVPFVIVKVAQTLDGKIATQTGSSKWISNEAARGYVHTLRSQADAILVGIGTVLEDNPSLTCRVSRGSPTRVVVDSKLRIPLASKVLKEPSAPTIIAATKHAPKDRIKAVEAKGAKVLIAKDKNGRVLLKSLIRELAKLDIVNLLIEGGAQVITSAFQAKIVDKVLFFIAPKIVGGENAPTSVEGGGVKKISDAIKLRDVVVKRFGDDILVEGYPVYK